MRIFFCELKKIWNPKTLLILAALGALTWFAFMREAMLSFESLQFHGSYGHYQTEMFALYGDTLEPEELAEFDIPGKKAEAIAEMEAIIAREPILAENNVRNYAEYAALRRSGGSGASGEASDRLRETIYEMELFLQNWRDDISLSEWYLSPLMRLDTLEALEERYVHCESHLIPYADGRFDRPVAARAAEKLLASGNNSLISDYLPPSFSFYAAVAGVFSVLAGFILAAPLLVIDRSRGITKLQYASKVGRRILRIQSAAVVVSALAVSSASLAALYAPFAIKASDYWNAGMMHLTIGTSGIWLYDLAFGRYAIILAAMTLAVCVGAACGAFVLARFSANMVTMLIKSVAAAAALAATVAISVNGAFSYYNPIFNNVFKGRLTAPESGVCLCVMFMGIAAMLLTTARERKIDAA